MGRWRYRVEAIDIPPEGVVLDRRITLFARPGEMMGDPRNHILVCLTEEEVLEPPPAAAKTAGTGALVSRKRGQRAAGSAADPDGTG